MKSLSCISESSYNDRKCVISSALDYSSTSVWGCGVTYSILWRLLYDFHSQLKLHVFISKASYHQHLNTFFNQNVTKQANKDVSIHKKFSQTIIFLKFTAKLLIVSLCTFPGSLSQITSQLATKQLPLTLVKLFWICLTTSCLHNQFFIFPRTIYFI